MKPIGDRVLYTFTARAKDISKIGYCNVVINVLIEVFSNDDEDYWQDDIYIDIHPHTRDSEELRADPDEVYEECCLPYGNDSVFAQHYMDACKAVDCAIAGMRQAYERALIDSLGAPMRQSGGSLNYRPAHPHSNQENAQDRSEPQ